MEAAVKHLVIALVLLIAVTGFGQTSFYKVFSGNGYDKAEGVAQLPDSSFLITGSSSSFAEAPSQVFLMHIDSAGNFLWSKSYGTPEFEEGKRVLAVPGFGYYLAGTTSGGPSHNFDTYLFFTDVAGNKTWETITDKGGWERVHDAVLLPDTTVFIVGETDNNPEGRPDILLSRYSKTGVLLWTQQRGTTGDDLAITAELLNDSTVIVGGTMYVTDSLQNKAYLGSFHKNGTLNWEKTYGVEGDKYQLNDIDIVPAGIRAVGQRMKTGKTDYDAYTLGVASPTGVLLGAEEHYADGNERYVAFVPYTNPYGNYFMATQSINPSVPTYPEGEDCFLIRVSNGLYWDNYGVNYSGVGQDQVNQMIRTSDGFAIAVGFSTTYGPGGNSMMAIKIGNDAAFPTFTSNPPIINIVHTPEISQLNNLLVYPNPVTSDLFIQLPDSDFDYSLLDETGRMIDQGSAFAKQSVDFSQQPAGIYFLNITKDSGESAVVRIVK